MKKKELKELLNELGPAMTEPVGSDLGEEIKRHIPRRLERHRIGWDTINIIVDLRMSRSVAAAAIIITLILFAGLFGGRDSAGNGVFRDSILLIKYWGSGGKSDVSAVRSRYEHLLHRGEDITWYGDCIDPEHGDAVLMQRKLPDGVYVVTFVNGREKDVTAEELIRLLGHTLQERGR
jgi:hypothetical protein